MIDVPLEDIDRIEVIRGPGVTVWGANAANGVINIITMDTSLTQGGLVTTGGGTEYADSLIQYGGRIGQTWTYRIFSKYLHTGNSVFPDGRRTADTRQGGHAGFRSGWQRSPKDSFSAQVDFLKTNESQNITTLFVNALPALKTFNDPLRNTSGDILARWNHTLADGSQMSLQMYDSASHHLDLGFIDSQIRSWLDLPHRLEWDNTFSYVSKLAAGSILQYVRFDTRLGRRVGESVDVSLVGQNMLSPGHADFDDLLYPLIHTLVERSVYGKVAWRF